MFAELLKMRILSNYSNLSLTTLIRKSTKAPWESVHVQRYNKLFQKLTSTQTGMATVQILKLNNKELFFKFYQAYQLDHHVW